MVLSGIFRSHPVRGTPTELVMTDGPTLLDPCGFMMTSSGYTDSTFVPSGVYP